MSFETAMKRLDEISVQMEQPDITLDNSMKCYKEAVELIAFCRSCSSGNSNKRKSNG